MGEGLIVIAVLLATGIVVGILLFRRVRIEAAGMVRANDFTDEKLRKAAIKAASEAKVGGLPREDAQALIEELVRHAVAKEYANIYRGTPVRVTESWPAATCIITENIAVIEVWVGHSMDREGLRPVRAEIQRQAPLKLDNKRPIREALDEMTAPPPKKPAPRRAKG